jgi:hypothetical protein
MPILIRLQRNRPSQDLITISGKGLISFYAGFNRLNKGLVKSHLICAYSKINSTILIRFTNQIEPGSVTVVNFGKASNTTWASCRSFFKFFELDLDRVRGYYKYEKVAVNGADYFALTTRVKDFELATKRGRRPLNSRVSA